MEQIISGAINVGIALVMLAVFARIAWDIFWDM
jgi:hypothetical protein